MRIIFREAPVKKSDEEKRGIIFDFDKEGKFVEMEILDASRRMERENPRSVEYGVAG